MKYLVVGTAGHIDHGKSALVRALTGTDLDRLEEEKRRGITIDLGFAHLDLAEGVKVGFIDVPGHERFVKNMLAGVGGIDLVLLVIAADESVKPQTREHFDICRLLGIEKGVVVLTKSDLVERDILDLVKLEVQDFVKGSFLEGAPIVAVSSKTGEGLETLKAELGRLARELAARSEESHFRLPIDRVFVMKGFGVVVTGTMIAGKIEKEAEVEIFPLGRRVRVRGIEVHNAPAEVAVAGQRTALSLGGVEARELARGMVLAPPDLFQAAPRLDCALTLLPSSRPLKNRARVHFQCGAAEALAEVVLLELKELKPGQRAYAQLRLADPCLYLPGDRFIIRQFSPVTTIGGGVVLENEPSRHRAGDASVGAALRIMEQGDREARVELLAQQAGELSLAELVRRTGWLASEAVRTAKALEERKQLMLLGQPPSLFVHSKHFQALSESVLHALEQFHSANPLDAGMTKEELRGRITPRSSEQPGMPSVALSNAVLQSLAALDRIETKGETVRLIGRQVQLGVEELRAKEQISRAFEAAELAVPSARDILTKLQIDRPRAEKILQILLKEKALLKVTEDLIFHRSALEKLRALLARHKGKEGRISVSKFKEMTGLGRKDAIPLLEYLDRERVTRREGEDRIIL